MGSVRCLLTVQPPTRSTDDREASRDGTQLVEAVTFICFFIKTNKSNHNNINNNKNKDHNNNKNSNNNNNKLPCFLLLRTLVGIVTAVPCSIPPSSI